MADVISFRGGEKLNKRVGPKDPPVDKDGVADIEEITDYILEHIDNLMYDSTQEGQLIELDCITIETEIDGNTFFDDAFKISMLHQSHQSVAPGISSFRMAVNAAIGFEKAAEPLLYLDQIVYMLAGSLNENKAFSIHSKEMELKLVFPAGHPSYDRSTVLIVNISIPKGRK